MPCAYDESTEEIAERQRKRDQALVKEETKKYEALLCSACRELESQGYDFDKNPALSIWWHEHKMADEKERLEAQALEFEKRSIMAALAKSIVELNDDEKALLRKHKYL